MKKYLILSLCLLFSSAAFAQQIKYQGEVQVGYGFGVGDISIDRVNAHMINGARFNQYLSAGLGVGLDYYHGNGESYFSLPIYVNVKGYLPLSDKISLFASLDCGYSVSLSGEEQGGWKADVKGFLITPAVGASFKIADSKAINLSLGYMSQKIAYGRSGGSTIKDNANAVGLKVGYAF